MRLEISLLIIALILIAAIIIQIKSAKRQKHLQAQDGFINAQSKLLHEADELVSDESMSEDEFYERSKVISEKLEKLQSTKPQV